MATPLDFVMVSAIVSILAGPAAEDNEVYTYNVFQGRSYHRDSGGNYSPPPSD